MTWWHSNPMSRVFWDNPRASRVAARFRPLAALFVLYRVNATIADSNPWHPVHVWWRIRALRHAMRAYHWGRDFRS